MNLRTKTLLLGGIAGALLGVGAAYLFLREAEARADGGDPQLPAVQPGDALKVTLGVLTAIRGIVNLGRPGA